MKYIIYMLSCVFVFGCASVRVSDLSDDSKFSKYVGREFTLKDDALLCKDGFLGDGAKAKPKGNELVLTDRETCHYGGAVAKVPEGTTIHIDKVLKHHHIPPLWRHIYFVGNLEASNGATLDFYYFYGSDSSETGELPWQHNGV